MSIALGAGIGAGAFAAAAYLDAKYHFSDDLGVLRRRIRNQNAFAKAERRRRISVWYLVADACHKYPDNIAIWSRCGNVTYQELHDQSVRYAHWMLELGVGRDEWVAIYLQNSPQFMMLWFACLCIGAAPAFINYNLEGKALLHCLSVCKAKVLVVDPDSKCLTRITVSQASIEAQGIKVFVHDNQLKARIASQSLDLPGHEYRCHLKAGDPFCMIYTSGTTGLPKGCPFPIQRFHMSGAHLEPQYSSRVGIDRWYNAMPLYHGTGGITSCWGIVSGIGIAIAPRFSTSGFWPDINDSESTVFVYVGEVIRYLLNAPPSPLERSHKLRVAYGNGLRPDVWQKFQERFNVPEVAEFFSSSEGMLSMTNRSRGPYLRNCVGHHGLLWRFWLRNTIVPVKIDYETGDIWRNPQTGFAQRMPFAEGGQILIAVQDPATIEFRGYWGSEEATKKKFLHDVFTKGDIWYSTGDALRRMPDGHWHFLDRLGDTYRWKSENISTTEVSRVIGEFPGIREASVYGVLVPKHDGKAGCAALHLGPEFGESFGYGGLLKHMRARLPRYAVPLFLRIVTASSHIHNFKQNKVPLQREGIDIAMKGTADPAGLNDKILWLPPKTDAYVEFGEKDWGALQTGRATF